MNKVIYTLKQLPKIQRKPEQVYLSFQFDCILKTETVK